MKYFIIIIVLGSLFISCKKEKNCQNLSFNTGLIVSELDMGKCYSFMTGDKYLIKDSIEYNNLSLYTIDSIQTALSCDEDPDKPGIDFDKYYLVGAKTEARGCIVTYGRDITYNSSAKVLDYKIDVYQCGNCTDLRYNMNWVIIDKDAEIDNLSVSIEYIKESN